MSAVAPGRFGDDFAEILAQPVVGHAALDGHAQVRHVANLMVLLGAAEDRLGQVLAHLVLVDVKGGGELDVADVIAAQDRTCISPGTNSSSWAFW